MMRSNGASARARAAMALTLLLIAACASPGASTPDPFLGEAGADEILLTVHNNDRRPATIYAYWEGLKQRVGTVTGSKTETFRMRWRADTVQIGYELLGARAVGGAPDYVDGDRSDPIYVSRGDHLDFVIQPRG